MKTHRSHLIALVAALALSLTSLVGTGTPSAFAATDPVTGERCTAPEHQPNMGIDRTFQTFTDSNGTTSQYHLYMSKVDLSQPFGVVIRLHGDGDGQRVREFDRIDASWDRSTLARELRDEAGQRNMIVLQPLSPDNTNNKTWWGESGQLGIDERARNSAWVTELLEEQVMAKYLNVDSSKLMWYGYSGGSEFISYELLLNDPQYVTYKAIMAGGGGAPWREPTWSKTRYQRILNEVELTWAVGDEDDGLLDDGSRDPIYHFDALTAAQKGHAYWTRQGFQNAKYDELKGYNHENIKHLDIFNDAFEPGEKVEPFPDCTTPDPDPTPDPVRTVERIGGPNRVATSVLALEEIIAQSGGIDSLVVAGFNGVPDVLAATPLAEREGTGVVYTAKNALSSQVRDVIVRQGVKEVFVVGGTQVVSDAVITELKSLNVSVRRLSGKDRYHTAVAIGQYMIDTASAANPVRGMVFANGAISADSLAAGPFATKYDAILIPTNERTAPAVVRTFVAKYPKLTDYAVGYQGDDVARQLGQVPVKTYAGANRYSTAAGVVRGEFMGSDRVYVASGIDGVDAAVASPLAGMSDSGILLTRADSAPQVTLDVARQFQTVVVVGGTKVVTDAVIAQLRK